MLARLATELRDLRDLVLVPLLSACLPRRVGWALLRFFARFEGLFGDASRDALTGRLAFSSVADEKAWRQQLRLVLLADASDFYVARLGGWRRIARRFESVQGQWPEQGPFCALGLHWGAALWTLHHLKAQGTPCAMVLAPLDPAIANSRWIASRYWLARGREIKRAGGDAVIFTGNGRAVIEEHLKAGRNVLCLADVPLRAEDWSNPQAASGALSARVLGRTIWIRGGVFSLLAQSQTPVVSYHLSIDLKSGQRTLHIDAPVCTSNPEPIANLACQLIERAVAHHDASWHLWRGFGRQLAQTQGQAQNEDTPAKDFTQV